MTGDNLTEYTSAELSVLIHAVVKERMDADLDLILEKKHAERRKEILDLWYAKLHEARKIVKKQENIELN